VLELPQRVYEYLEMKISRLIGASLCLLFLFESRCVSADECKEDASNKGCVCTFDNKNVDLRSVGRKDGTA